MSGPHGLRRAMVTRRARAVFLAVASLFSITGTGVAWSDDHAAAEIFRTGSKAYARGDYRAAALAFEAAFREAPRGASMYNAARAWEKAGDLARAADDYDVASATGELGSDDSADARKRLEALERAVGTVEAAAPQGAWISLAHVERARPPVRVHLAAGDYEAHVEYADGRNETRPVQARAGEHIRLDFAPPREAGTTAEPAAPAAAPSSPAPLAPKRDMPAHGSTVSTLGWVSLGTAAVAGGAAVVLGIEALHARDTFDAGGQTDRAAHDRAAALRTWTNVAWAAAGALAVTGVVLLIAAPRSKSQVARTPYAARF